MIAPGSIRGRDIGPIGGRYQADDSKGNIRINTRADDSAWINTWADDIRPDREPDTRPMITRGNIRIYAGPTIGPAWIPGPMI